MSEQNYANHTQLVPLYHFAGTPLVLILFVWSVVHVIKAPSQESAILVLISIIIAVHHALVRLLPLKAQDRLIRLEEQLRLARLLPEPLRSRIGEFTVDQLIALRFASDEELPELAARVLDQKLTSRKAVKQAIRKWRPDTFRV